MNLHQVKIMVGIDDADSNKYIKVSISIECDGCKTEEKFEFNFQHLAPLTATLMGICLEQNLELPQQLTEIELDLSSEQIQDRMNKKRMN